MVITIVWLIVRRFLYGPFYLLVWLPLKLCWWMLSLCASAIGAGGSHDSDIFGGVFKARVSGEGSILNNKPKVEVKGILEDLPQIPQSLISTPDVVPELSEDHGVVIEVAEPKPVVKGKSSYQKPNPPPFTPLKEVESLFEQVGQALDKQCVDTRARKHTPVVQEARHDEL